jgi:hypothetical protein
MREKLSWLLVVALCVVFRLPYLLLFARLKSPDPLCMLDMPGPKFYAGRSFAVPPVEGLAIKARKPEFVT